MVIPKQSCEVPLIFSDYKKVFVCHLLSTTHHVLTIGANILCNAFHVYFIVEEYLLKYCCYR